MEKKTAGLVSVIAGLATFGTAQAAMPPTPPHAEIMRVSSYADLLTPISNARELLQASNAAQAAQPPQATPVQYNQGPPPGYHHHHHHHHHHYYPPPPPPHHHHHHSGVTIVVPGVGVLHSGN